MEIYLVRHGQTSSNLARRHQVDHAELTQLGKQQAIRVSKQIKQLKPTHLISSTLLRAIETAKVIGEECGLVPETTPLFVELRRPSSFLGHYLFSLRSWWYYFWWYAGFTSRQREGAETYKKLMQRISEAQQYLTKLPIDAKVVVVSHAAFISFFVNQSQERRLVRPFGLIRIFFHLITMPNTAMTHLRVTKEANGDFKWQLVDKKSE